MSVRASALQWMSRALFEDEVKGLRRTRRMITRKEPGRVVVEGEDYIDVSSNDYLGLACDPRVCESAARAIREFGYGSTASPLVSGYSPIHAELERSLADFEQSEAAVVFPTGFAANLGIITALVGPGDVVFSDRRNHASLIDGCRLSRATIRIFDGNDCANLEASLARERSCRRKWIVTDSVFSMDGDIAPLDRLLEIADQQDASLYVDEAHATGVLGANGRGAAEHLGVCDQIPLRMGTLSKALGSMGGFLSCSQETADWLIGHARPYVYSTALPAAAAAAAKAALDISQREPWRRRNVLAMTQQLLEGVNGLEFMTGQLSRPPASAIVPLIVGSAEHAMDLSAHLASAGFWAVAIRPPSVAEGLCRVRLTVCAAHEPKQIDRLLDALSSWEKPNAVKLLADAAAEAK